MCEIIEIFPEFIWSVLYFSLPLPQLSTSYATLYILEENLRSCKACGEEIREQRCSRALLVMDAMEAWMESVQHRYTPDDPLGKALEYAYKLWPRMRRLLEWLR